MALSQTNLTAAIGATDLVMNVASGTGFPTSGGTTPASNFLVRIDKEYMLAIQQPTSGVIKLAQRGYNGSFAAPHDTLAKVEVSSTPGDFAGNAPSATHTLPAYLPNYQTIGQNLTFTATQIAAYGNQPQNFALTKATALAVTLVAPSAGQDGLEMVFTNLTAAAHVITATSLINDGVTGEPHTTLTFAAFAGATITLQAQNLLWNVISNNNVVVS